MKKQEDLEFGTRIAACWFAIGLSFVVAINDRARAQDRSHLDSASSPTSNQAIAMLPPDPRWAGSEILVSPPGLLSLAQNARCPLVQGYIGPPGSNYSFPDTSRSDGVHQFVAGWCLDNNAKSTGKYKLLVSVDDSSNPLSKCPHEIPRLPQVGQPSFEQVRMKAQGFVFLDRRELVRGKDAEEPISFGILVTHETYRELFACVLGRWAGTIVYTPR